MVKPIMMVPKKAQSGEIPQKQLYVYYQILNSLFQVVGKANSKAHGILPLEAKIQWAIR